MTTFAKELLGRYWPSWNGEPGVVTRRFLTYYPPCAFGFFFLSLLGQQENAFAVWVTWINTTWWALWIFPKPLTRRIVSAIEHWNPALLARRRIADERGRCLHKSACLQGTPPDGWQKPWNELPPRVKQHYIEWAADPALQAITEHAVHLFGTPHVVDTITL